MTIGSGRSAHTKVMMWDDALASDASAWEGPPSMLPPAAASSVAVRVIEVPQLPPVFQV